MSKKTSGKGVFLNDIDVLTKALYDDNSHPRIVNSTASSRSKAVTKSKSKVNSTEDRFLKDKKSIWSWNTLKSLTHVKNKRFNCCFSLQVHSIEGLPRSFENLTLCVTLKRRDGELTTRPAPVRQGVAEFEELLTNSCLVYGSRSGPHHSAKYEAKHFLLYASLFGDPEVDLGKHRVDLTRLLPLTLEELEDEKSSGKWTTTYRLSGKAKGAILNVSFGYSVVGSGAEVARSSVSSSGQSQSQSQSLPVDDIKDLHEILPVSKSELSESVSVLYKKLEEEKSTISVDFETTPHEGPNQYYGNIINIPTKENEERDKEIVLKDSNFESFLVKESESQTEERFVTESPECSNQYYGNIINIPTKENEERDKEIVLKGSKFESFLVKDSESQTEEQEFDDLELLLKEETEILEAKTDYKEKVKSLKLDYDTEVVADEFLNMLGIEHSPFSLTSESESNSPRERLLRQFEYDSIANDSSLFNFNLNDEEEPAYNKTNASILEEMETKSLMSEWGLNENVFQGSPSRVDPSSDGPFDLPPLGEGLGPFVQTSNGGFLRSMNPEIFNNGKSGGNLIMQVSSPVVVPAEMGSGIMDVLQCLASVGIEKLSMQANKLMPLEDISGKTIQQIAWESTPSLEASYKQDSINQEPILGADHSTGRGSKKYDPGEADQEYVSLEDLAPLAMNKIEALSIEGLRIQSGMSENEAPSNITPQSIGEISALEGKTVNFDGSLGLEGTGGLKLLNVKNIDKYDEIDGIMGLSVTLDEWMRLDSGEIDDRDEMSERTSKILAAHHASDLMRARIGKKGSRKGGLLGNNFTVALMVQLRDPLRNFEPVGSPMLALVQVERVFVPPKPKVYASIFSLWNKDEEKVEENKEVVIEKKEESVLVPQFKITEVHVAGVKGEPEVELGSNKKGLWGSNSKKEQQAGSRWLVANGMGKKNVKHPLMKSKGGGGGGGDKSLWSVSSKGKGKVVGPPVRNPNVVIANETVKLLSGAGFI